MQVEIAIEGPAVAIKRLQRKIRHLVPDASPAYHTLARDSSQAVLLLHVAGPLLDTVLIALADAVEREEQGYPERFEIHVRDLASSEPPSGSHDFCQPFTPVLGLTIVPWQESISQVCSPRTLLLDPCHAFGTGKHPTTRLCLRLLLDLASAGESGPKEGARRIIDLGCGSGVLAIAAIKLGLGHEALGIDIDPQAIIAARKNVFFNGFEKQVIIRQASWEELEGEADLLIANLTTSVLLQAGRHFSSLLAVNGRAIASGFFAEQGKDIGRFFSACHLEVCTSLVEDRWGASLLRRQSRP